MIINQVIISFIASDSADGEIILLIHYYHVPIKPGAIIGFEEKKHVDIILIKDVNRSFQISLFNMSISKAMASKTSLILSDFRNWKRQKLNMLQTRIKSTTISQGGACVCASSRPEPLSSPLVAMATTSHLWRQGWWPGHWSDHRLELREINPSSIIHGGRGRCIASLVTFGRLRTDNGAETSDLLRVI